MTSTGPCIKYRSGASQGLFKLAKGVAMSAALHAASHTSVGLLRARRANMHVSLSDAFTYEGSSQRHSAAWWQTMCRFGFSTPNLVLRL